MSGEARGRLGIPRRERHYSAHYGVGGRDHPAYGEAKPGGLPWLFSGCR
jgi:hypothetical protein